MTGYDLKACFDTSVANFWPADQSQIYRTLDKLADEGYIESRLEIQTDRPNRKVYSITESGRNELHRWLKTEMPPPTLREPFLVQLFFGSQLSRPELIELLEAQRRFHQEKLDRYEADYIPVEKEDMAFDGILRGMTLQLGIRHERNYVEWIDWCLVKLLKLP